MDFYQPQHLLEALHVLHEHKLKILAGGTDVYPALQTHTVREAVLDISRIGSLSGIENRGDHWRIGAAATWTDILNAELPPAFAAVQQSARDVGSIQIQNRATVIGNLCNASPAADGMPPLLILNAQIVLQSIAGERILALEDFILGNRKTARRNDELATELRIPRNSTRGKSNFTKLGARRYLVISIAMVAIRIETDTEGVITDCAIAIGACSAVALRLRRLEQTVMGRKRMDLASNALPISADAMDALSPIGDVRATAGYRKEAATKLIQRLLQQTAQVAS